MQVASHGYRINYETIPGGDPPVVLIHGTLQAGEDWIATGYGEQLAPGHRVIAIDQLGFGASDKPHDPDTYGLDNLVADVEAVLDAEAVDQAVIWGYSMGCALAEAFGRQHPDRTTALVLGGNLVGLSPTDRGNIFDSAAELLRAAGVRGYCEQAMPFLDETAVELFDRRNDAGAVALASGSLHLPHAGDGAPLPARTINYAGSQEPWHAVAEAVAEANDVPFATIADADHGVAFRSADRTTAMVLDFLAAAPR